MIKTASSLFCFLVISTFSFAQTNQEKAETLVKKYIQAKSSAKSNSQLKFSKLDVLNSSYSDTKIYKKFQYKIDSLKLEGRKIDARIPKMKTDAEISQAKKDSKHLSNQLVETSDQLIDFMTQYKGTQTGWLIKTSNQTSRKAKKTFYLDKELTRVTAAK